MNSHFLNLILILGLYNTLTAQNSFPVLPEINDITILEGSTNSIDMTASDNDISLKIDNPTIVVIGSSTADGRGASNGNDWVSLLDNYLGNTISSHTLERLSRGGTTSYHFRESGYTPPSDPTRPRPNTTINITMALSFDPDLIIVNLPSNDVANGYLEQETIDNFNAIKTEATNNGSLIYFQTTQPRNFFDLGRRLELFDKSERIKLDFAPDTINTYDYLVDFDNEYRIKSEYQFTDNIHVNDGGHNVIFERTVDGIEHLILGDILSYEILNAPSFVTYSVNDNTLEIDISPGAEDEGIYNLTVEATDLDGNKDSKSFSITVENDISLPVELISFKAYSRPQNISLFWNTSFESNNMGFEVERGYDGVEFNKIKFIKGSNNSSSVKEYFYNDYDLILAPIIYYRLRQIDFDGEYQFSKTISVKTHSQNPSFSIYPTDFSKGINIYSSSIIENLNLKSINGKSFLELSHLESINDYTILLNKRLNELPPSLYFIFYQTSDGNNGQKKIIKK